MTDADRVGEFGAIYHPALQRVRNLWVDIEPLVETTDDDIVEPTELRIELTDGIETAESARFDIRWSDLNLYSFHYGDSAVLYPRRGSVARGSRGAYVVAVGLRNR